MSKSTVGKIYGSVKESNQRAKDNTAQRKQAGESPESIILSRNDLDGHYDASRMIQTTLGGVRRNITNEDLAAFKANIKTAQTRFKGGITAKQVIDFSTQATRDRSSKQIHMVVPSRGTNRLIRFITNAGPDSKDSRHFVNVEFMGLNPAAVSEMIPRKAVNWLRKQPIKFECDCGAFTFWYRYIASIGNYNTGRNETGFPKVRNPNLEGVACKHALRVMSEIERGGVVQMFLQKLIIEMRASDTGTAQVKLTQEEADRATKGQSRRTTGNIISTTEQKKGRKRKSSNCKRIEQITKT